MKTRRIAPVLVLSTGRCGSTMLSDILDTHPEVLSLSEFFTTMGMKALTRNRLDGKAMWEIWRRHSPGLRVMLAGDVEGFPYPFDAPQARFSPRDIPSILCTTLPRLTPDFESLYDELEPLVRARPRAGLADHYHFLFGWLCERLGRRVWVERSGGSLMFGRRLTTLFPEARVVHIYRDGRDTALSMSRHGSFQALVAGTRKLQRLGVDPYRGDPLPALPRLLVQLMSRFGIQDKVMSQAVGLEAYGDTWSRMILSSRAYLSSLPSDRFLALRYEDFLQHPRAKLRELLEFIDPELVDDAWLDEAVRIPRPNPSRYPSLDAETRARLTRACLPGLQALGYAVEDITHGAASA